ncbi:hypothetical protein BKG89_07600 [Rodentibacter caecimuris]|uniref:Uncharacterized protein n=2 Tax=Rodentibacter caecimuris TaxID=1796644 RepID=A0ABX3KWY7_9PAST|nr:hypothetical protein BKG89_07600 [Rodentibacter heylii]
MLSRDWAPGVHYSIFRTEFLRENLIYFAEGLTSEDALFTVDVYIAKPDVRVIEISREFYAYRQRENSIITTVERPTLFIDIFTICQLLMQRFNKIEQLIENIKQTSNDESLLSRLSQVRMDILRTIAVSYSIAYRYQYLKFSRSLQNQVRHYFTPEILQFMEKFLSYKVEL